uniref:PRXQ n=1 Tax=Arundo donax TaxID=35708 RepID=A0A0A9B9G0_ARUDO
MPSRMEELRGRPLLLLAG